MLLVAVPFLFLITHAVSLSCIIVISVCIFLVQYTPLLACLVESVIHAWRKIKLSTHILENAINIFFSLMMYYFTICEPSTINQDIIFHDPIHSLTTVPTDISAIWTMERITSVHVQVFKALIITKKEQNTILKWSKCFSSHSHTQPG